MIIFCIIIYISMKNTVIRLLNKIHDYTNLIYYFRN